MENIKYYLNKYKVVIVCLIVVLIIILILFNKNDDVVAEEIIETTEEVIEEVDEKIKIDIKGYVEYPGVYELSTDSRVIDAINIAGGLKENANTDYINLSKKLIDEMIIIIYSNDEVSKYMLDDSEIIYIEYKCDCIDNINDACINESDTVNTNGIETSSKDSLISINSDNINELTSIPGIGESKAKSIIEYRKENGDFTNLEDIMNVSGIGEALYNKIKDSIKL